MTISITGTIIILQGKKIQEIALLHRGNCWN